MCYLRTSVLFISFRFFTFFSFLFFFFCFVFFSLFCFRFFFLRFVFFSFLFVTFLLVFFSFFFLSVSFRFFSFFFVSQFTGTRNKTSQEHVLKKQRNNYRRVNYKILIQLQLSILGYHIWRLKNQNILAFVDIKSLTVWNK